MKRLVIISSVLLGAWPHTNGVAPATEQYTEKLFTQNKTALPKTVFQTSFGMYKDFTLQLNNLQTQLYTLRQDSQFSSLYYSTSLYQQVWNKVFEFGLLKAKAHIAYNQSILYELFFGQLERYTSQTSPNTVKRDAPTFETLLLRSYDSIESYLNELLACVMGSSGWVITAYCIRENEIKNFIINDPHGGLPLFTLPIVIINTQEYQVSSYFSQNDIFPLMEARRKYFTQYIKKNTSWRVIEVRTKQIVKASYEISY